MVKNAPENTHLNPAFDPTRSGVFKAGTFVDNDSYESPINPNLEPTSGELEIRIQNQIAKRQQEIASVFRGQFVVMLGTRVMHRSISNLEAYAAMLELQNLCSDHTAKPVCYLPAMPYEELAHPYNEEFFKALGFGADPPDKIPAHLAAINPLESLLIASNQDFEKMKSIHKNKNIIKIGNKIYILEDRVAAERCFAEIKKTYPKLDLELAISKISKSPEDVSGMLRHLIRLTLSPTFEVKS